MCFLKKSSWYGFPFASGVFPNFLIFFKQANLLQWMLLCCFGDFFCRYYWIRRLAVIWFLQCFVGWGLWRRIEKGYCPGKEYIWDYFSLVLISSDSLHGKSNRGVSKCIINTAQSCLSFRYSGIWTGVRNVSHGITHEVLALQGN